MLIGRGDVCRCCSARAQEAALIVTSLVLQLWSVAATSDFGVPANLTIVDSTPYAVCLTWTLSGGGKKGSLVAAPVHLQLIYRPVNASYRVVADLLGRRRSATLDNLRPETQYRLVMTSSVNGSLVGTSPVIFFHTPPTMPLGFVPSSYSDRTGMLSAEEIGIIVIVLGVWMMAIVLFFNRWGKIRMLEPYEYNFKYHHPIPEVATHRPSCPLADGAPLLQTSSFDRHCSVDRRLAPYGRRCSSLSAYLTTEPRMSRNNSEPAPPQPGQPRAASYRCSMQELRREPSRCSPDPATTGGQAQTRLAQDPPVVVGLVAVAGQGGSVGQGGNVGQVERDKCNCRAVGEMGVASRAGVPAGRGSPTSRKDSSREVGITRGRSITGEDGRVGGEPAGNRRGEPSRGLERRRGEPSRGLEQQELLVTTELVDVRDVGGETSVTPVKGPELDRSLNLSNPARLVCCEDEKDLVRDSEV